ncbi:MAG: pyruvate dehydrogenase complex dihydrolipoamide acetyltransferase [Phenylobacterium sp.]|uniref:pyruvate dehydrogenase complex dihydrolipoamide acetyltransferase n=1 Tax=Phenylobacterium sp. TaxID=1871053 RepID=UPI00271C7C7D|nr:pyruvate dehydrogenase complex dihydrolipoamide acetyltransferase [Phenylobacterium sp.]MDO8410256.1 pyruvate dehydrogenase complex dihydrolipoamide acetyltransferase [Phenylobacterium sp.]
MTDILMPALSPTMEEGTLAKWLVKKGDTVSAGDVIAEIETDKATMEVEAVDEGVVEEILVEAGTEGVKVNAPIARLSGGVEAKAPEPKPAKEAAPEAAPAKAERPAKAEPAPAKASPAKTPGGERIFASPLARRIAEQKGLDLAAIEGSGPHGRIIERDVKDAKPGAKPATTTATTPSERRGETRPVQSLQQMGIPEGSYELIPLDGMRKTVARRMTDSFRDVPHFPLTIDLEIDRLLESRGRINKMLEKDGVKVSVNDIILKACAVALMRVPEANASYSPEGIALHHHADIAMAVAVEGGLITPIVRKCETKGLAQIAQETKDLAERARTRKLKPEEFQGGTFSVSNLGMFGIKSFGSIINEPQGAILSVGAGTKQPVVRGDQLAIATVMSVTMTCDHRVVDGATGARWLEAFKALIEEPLAMIV